MILQLELPEFLGDYYIYFLNPEPFDK